MILPSDLDYQLTKAIKQGKASMENQFIPLAEWVDKTYGVKTINVLYSIVNNGKRPRLQLIFETEAEAKKFWSEFGYDPVKQKEIATQFEKIFMDQGLKREDTSLNPPDPENSCDYKTENLLVIFSAFEPVARAEAIGNIPEERIEALKKEMEDKGIWEISRYGSFVTFFFYTDQQREESSKNGLREFFADQYFNLLKDYDEFGYFKRETFGITLDSKENFDENFEGNWQHYYQ